MNQMHTCTIDLQSHATQNNNFLILNKKHSIAAWHTKLLKEELSMIIGKLDSYLADAQNALHSIQLYHLHEIMLLNHPTIMVSRVLGSVGLLLGLDESYNSVRAAIMKVNFMQELINFDIGSVTIQKLAILRKKYFLLDYLNINAVKTSSIACASLCKWVIAVEKYSQFNSILNKCKADIQAAEAIEYQLQEELKVKKA